MGKSAQRKRNEAEIKQSNRAFDKTRRDLTGFKFEDKYAGLEAQQAQAGQLGSAQGYDPTTAQAGQIGQAQGYQAQGYNAAQAQAALADRVDLGEDTGRTNQFNQLQVGTAASDLQRREQDRSLAALAESGAITGGGGATALAQQAAGSKADIAANIQQQELQNQQLRAQGATDVQREALAQRNLSRQADIQQGQFNAGQQQAVNIANQQATNRASEFGAGAQNRAAEFGAQSANQFTQLQFGAQNEFAIANQQAANRAAEFGATAQNQFTQEQFRAGNEFALQNTQAQNNFALQRAAGAQQTQQLQYEQLANLYSADANRKAAANSAEQQRRAQNFQNITGAVTGLASAAATAASGGVFGGK